MFTGGTISAIPLSLYAYRRRMPAAAPAGTILEGRSALLDVSRTAGVGLNLRRLRPTPAVLLTSSKADLPSRIVPAGAAAGIRRRYAYNESGMADMVPPVNIWNAGIYSN